MRLIKQLLVLSAAGAIAAGCSDSESSCPDAGCVDASATDAAVIADGGASDARAADAVTADAGAGDAIMLWGLTRSTPGDGGPALLPRDYVVTGVANVKDDCMIGVGTLVGKTLPVIYDENAMSISIGTIQGSPPGPSLGSGKISDNVGTLTRDNFSGTAGAACTWHQKNVSKLVLVYHDKFTLDVQEDEDMFSAGCTAMTTPPPAGGKCTSTWQWTFEIKK